MEAQRQTLKFLKLALLSLVLFGVVPCALASDPSTVSDLGEWQGVSPNGKHFAALTVRAEATMTWRKDIGTGILEVVEPAKLTEKFTASFDSEPHGDYFCFELGDRVGARAQWSPDSRYLVMATASLGGHSPWHCNAYVYRAADHTLRYMDDVIGLVLSPDFKFSGPHTVRMGIGAPDRQGGIDTDHPIKVDIDLDMKTLKMKQQAAFQKGDLSK